MSTSTKRSRTFGEALRALRDQTGLSYRKMAEVVHVSYRSLYEWERGRTPRRLQLEALYRAFPRFRADIPHEPPAAESA